MRDLGDFRRALLTTTSALALIALGGEAWAQCADNNVSPPINNTGSINCITFNNEQGGTANGNFTGATTFSGSVVNSGTLTPTGVNQNYPAGRAGTDAGISVVGPGVNLIGNITNTGTITGTNAQYSGINIGGGGGGSGAPGATVQGSITNDASISGIQSGIVVSGAGSLVTGSVINAAGATIINSPTAGGVGLSVAAGASIAGSLINNGVINTGGSGLLESAATVAGNVSNGGQITIHNGFTAMALVNGGSVGGSVINTGTVVNLNASSNIGLWASGQTIGGGITNSGSITGGFGVYFSALSNTLGATAGGNVSNGGTIVATTNSGIGIHGATVRGALINSGSITAAAAGGIVLGTTGGVTAKGTIAGGITNSGAITAKSGILIQNGGVVTGGINNSGTLQASNLGIGVGGTGLGAMTISTFGGGIANSGTISAGGNYGIYLNGISTFTGGISNAGTLMAGYEGIRLQNIGTFGGGITNSGTISVAHYNAITVGNTRTGGGGVSVFSGGIANSGTMMASRTGILLFGVSTFAGGITNSGTILARTSSLGAGILIGFTNALPAPISTFTGGITNSGTIFGAGYGIAIGNVSVFTGGITNTGMISAGGTGIFIQNVPSVSIFDSGTIIGGNGTAIKFASGIDTLTLGPGWSITGNVLGAGSDILQLGGSGTGSFNLSSLGTQFTGFTQFNTVSATWDLTGSSPTFTGTATISGGDLVIGTASSPNVTYGGSIVVDPGGTLSGHGTILGGVTNNGGTVMPGGSIGTLTVGGNYVQTASGTFVAQLTPAAASLLAVSGSAKLAGTLEAAPAPGTYGFNAKYPIITAGGGVSGTFATFINELPSVNLTVDYLPNEVELVTAGANFIGQTRNQGAVANALNLGSVAATGDFLTELQTIAALPSSQQQQVLASLGGQIYANVTEVSLQNRQLFLGAMDERMQPLGPDGSPGMAVSGLVPGGWGGGANGPQMAALGSALGGAAAGASDPFNPPTDAQLAQAGGGAPGTPVLPSNVWARGFGQFGSLDNNGGALGGDYSTGGGAVGLDVIRTPQTILGLAAGGGQSTLSTNSLSENATISFFQLGAYGAQQIGGGFALDGAFIYAHDYYDISRSLVGLGRTATSSYGGNDAVVDVGVGRPFAYNGWQVTPRAGFTYYHIGQSQVMESGASSLDLLVDPASLNALRSRVGVAVSQPMLWGGSQVLPELRAGWTHDFLDERGSTLAALTGAPGVAFQQVGASTGRDAAQLGAGLSFAIAQTAVPGHLAAFVEYDATIAAHLTNNAFAAGLKLTW